MARNADCMCCPTMAQNRREGLTACSGLQVALNVVTKEAPKTEKLDDYYSLGDRRRPQPIPKEHDDLIEMLFPPPSPGRHRPRNPFPLTTTTITTSSLFSSPRRRSESNRGSVRWFRDRANSLLPPPKPDPVEFISTVVPDPPLPPDACYHSSSSSASASASASSSGEFSATLPPLQAAGCQRRRRNCSREFQGTEEEKWPDYIWRLDRKMDHHQCTCSGCKDAWSAIRKTYRRPIECYNVGAYFDNEFYYNAQREREGDGRPGRSRRSTEVEQTTRRKNVVCCTEAEIYYVPSPPPSPLPPLPPPSPPPSSGSASLGRCHAPRKQFYEGSAIDPDCCFRSSHHGRPDRRPDWLDASSGRRKDGSVGGLGGGAKWACTRDWKPETEEEIDDWMRIFQTSGSVGNPDTCDGDSGYMQSDAGIPMGESDEAAVSSSGTPDGRLYRDFNCVVPSGIFSERNNRICFEFGDYLTPRTSNATRFLPADDGKVEKLDGNDRRYYSERYYLSMDSSRPRFSGDRKEAAAAAAEYTFKSLQKREIIRSSQQSDFRHSRRQDRLRKEEEEEQDDHRLLADAPLHRYTSVAGEQQEMESDVDLAVEENVKTDCKEENKKQELPITSDETLNSLNIDSRESGERERNPVGDVQMDEKRTRPTAYSQTGKIEMEESQRSTDIDGDIAEVVESSGLVFHEREAIVRPKELAAPLLALRSCTQLELLLMSPPPQCSFMIEHSYANITDCGVNGANEVGLSVPVDYSDRCNSDQPTRPAKEMENKEAVERRKDFRLLEDAVNEMTISKTAEATRWQRANCKKNPVSQHVTLYKKFVNDYCHAYLPTLTEGLASVDKTDQASSMFKRKISNHNACRCSSQPGV